MQIIWVIGLVESIVLLLFCLYMVWSYAAKDRTPTYIIILTVFSWFVGFMVMFIIPIDMYATGENDT